MPVTALDAKTALIVLDLQRIALHANPAPYPMAQVVANARTLADAFRARGLPVVLVNVDAGAPGRTDFVRNDAARPDGWTELLPELNAQPHDHLITKRTWGAFQNTDLEANLREMEVTQLIITGYATSISVESTARQAFEKGFNVTIALDAVTDLDAASHEHSVKRILPRVAETGSTKDILTKLSAYA